MDFNTIYNKHFTELYHFAKKHQGFTDDPADILQEVFTKLFIEIQSGANIENPRAWLFKVLINSLRTHFKYGKFRVMKNNEIARCKQLSMDMHESYVIDEQHYIVIQSISKMPEKEKSILLLYHNGFTYKEISGIMNIGYSSVGTCIARAVEKLKTILKAEYNELFD